MPDAQSLNAIRAALGQRSIVLVGLMGCGKSAIGRRLAAKLGAAVRRRRRGDREGGRQEHRGHLRRSRRAVLPRGRAQGAGAAAALGPAGAGDRRRRLHERGDARRHRRARHLGVAQGRAAAARAPRRQARQPSAAQGRRSRGRAAEPHDDALSGLCAGRSSPSKAATCRTRSSSPRSSSASAEHLARAPPRWPDERDTQPARRPHRQRAAGRPRLRRADRTGAAGACRRVDRCAARRGARAPSSPTRMSRAIISARSKPRLKQDGRHVGSITSAAGRVDQELPRARAAVRAPARAGPRARRSRRRAGRRRHRRPRRICRGDPASRRALRANSDLAAGAGGFLRRRQDRHRHAAGQEPHRRLPSAEPRARRHRHAAHAAGARDARRLRRGGEVRPARRRGVLRLAREELAGRVRAAKPSR